jgi:hypothetical protein
MLSSKPRSPVACCSHGRKNVRNYWGFQLLPSSGILNTSRHNVDETGSFSLHELMVALSNGPDRVGVSPLPEDGKNLSFQNVVFSNFQNTGQWSKSKTSEWFKVLFTIVRNPLKPAKGLYCVRVSDVCNGRLVSSHTIDICVSRQQGMYFQTM